VPCSYATFDFVASLAEKKKRKRKTKKRRERKKIEGKRKNRLSNFLEIVIDNLYLLYYYQVIKIEDVNYIIK
jgi:ATP adenylyltransferase/5',5'''-P-1,P-4-tetraphosphate phosphorylase II